MNSELSDYLADVYSVGFDKRAAGETAAPPAAPPSDTGRDMALGAGIGAGLGGLGGLASYYLQDAKKRRRSSLLNHVLAGGLLGGGAGAAAPMISFGDVGSAFKTGDRSIGPGNRAVVGGATDAVARPLLAYTLTKQLENPDTRVEALPRKAVVDKKGIVTPGKSLPGRAVPAIAQLLRWGMFGNVTDPDDNWGRMIGRSTTDAITGGLISHMRNPIRPAGTSWMRSRGAGALGGVVAGLLADILSAKAQSTVRGWKD